LPSDTAAKAFIPEPHPPERESGGTPHGMLPPWLAIVAPKYGPDAAVPLKNKAEETAPIVEIAGKSYPIRTLCRSSA
jgi:hypothetical protein